jgi:hypothetical protein
MLIRIKKLFLLVSALGYGFLGGGPSLWAMDLRPQDPVMACLQMGCTCRLHPGKGVCCCLANRALIRRHPELATDAKFWKSLHLAPPGAPGGCGLQAEGGCPMDSGHGLAPIPQQLHLAVSVRLRTDLALSAAVPWRAHPGRSLDPAAPDPRPD